MDQESFSETVALTASLIAKRSLTPDDDGCQQLIDSRLASAGFVNEQLPFGTVKNLWSRHGQKHPLFVFAGHSDVVPPGTEELWETPPFTPAFRDGYLYGRGACDMKSGLAAMVTAACRFVAKHPDHKGSLAFLITSDEEGDSINGTAKVVELLQTRQEMINWCLVGEPSSTATVGDIIKNGRRGSLTGKLQVHGIQGHVAYPETASNPIHMCAPAIVDLCSHRWDNGNQFFGKTTLQFSNIHACSGSDNVIPAALEAIFNLRFSTEVSPEHLMAEVETILTRHCLNFEIDWRVSGMPFLTQPAELVTAVLQAVQETTGITPVLSTAGGTSDGRFIAPTGAQVVELGAINSTAHKINECVKIADIDTLTAVYESVLQKLLL